MAKLLAIVMLIGLGCGDDVGGTGGTSGVGGSGGAGGTAGRGGSGGMAGSGGTGGIAGIAAPMIDAPATDGTTGGTDASATECTGYCNCMVNGNCQGSANGFNNVGTCQTACLLLSASQVACRANECNQAQDSGDVQCQHA